MKKTCRFSSDHNRRASFLCHRNELSGFSTVKIKDFDNTYNKSAQIDGPRVLNQVVSCNQCGDAMDVPFVFVSVAAALVAAQGLKLLLIMLSHHLRLRWKDIVVTGGMPSTHCAIVTALCLSILRSEGWQSTSFVIAAVLAIIVVRDALGVRRTAGDEGRTINKIIRLAHVKTPPVHYSLGHTPSEVAVGMVIGALISIALPL